ncbi:hypothetical protein [Enterovibrio paralichthyis]|uniref:hypothetical protein n=1 Tax=Enterovibrio paralichthyis TaxID=2853805 RepID=UPI001C497223|nr:hypothetical protein [Enterovibrio paralichthyis]MBV7297024.1 hypothetical protein [Enterovibrio paralichthyis]
MRSLPKFLFGLSICFSFLLILVASTDPILNCLSGTFIEPLLVNSLSGNSIVFNLSMGILVSCIFYIIVVYLPERQKRKDLAPELDRHVASVIYRVYAIVRDVHYESQKSFDIAKFSEDEFRDACKSFNPKLILKLFQGSGMQSVHRDFGFQCFNNWSFALKSIDEVMRYLPYVDTGLVKLLNEVRNCSFGITSSSLNNLDKLTNTDMEAWASCIYKAYTVTYKLSDYYKNNINKNHVHPAEKNNVT